MSDCVGEDGTRGVGGVAIETQQHISLHRSHPVCVLWQIQLKLLQISSYLLNLHPMPQLRWWWCFGELIMKGWQWQLNFQNLHGVLLSCATSGIGIPTEQENFKSRKWRNLPQLTTPRSTGGGKLNSAASPGYRLLWKEIDRKLKISKRGLTTRTLKGEITPYKCKKTISF